MNKENLYVGMRVRVKSDYNHLANGIVISDYVGTVIDIKCARPYGYDALVEFDDDIRGHDGLGWGSVVGRYGHCLWANACIFDAVIEPPVVPAQLDIRYESFFT